MVPDPDRHGDASNVVHESGAAKRADRRRVEADRLARGGGQSSDHGGVTGEIPRREVGEVAYRSERPVDCMPVEHESRLWLAREGDVPQRSGSVHRQDVAPVVDEGTRDLGIERVRCALADH